MGKSKELHKLIDKNLVLAIDSSNRIKVLAKSYVDNNDELIDSIESWRNKKTIVTDDLFEAILLTKRYSKDEFAIGIKKLTAEDADLLYVFLQNQEWYHLHNEIMNYVDQDSKEEGFQYFVRPYLNWFASKLDKYVQGINIDISEKVRATILEAFTSEVNSICLKTVVYDLDDFFKESLPEINSTSIYFEKRFQDKLCYTLFFNDYPVLARLLATRTRFMFENVVLFMDGITSLNHEEWQTFRVTEPIMIEEVSMDNGDSHNRGKSVIIFSVNGEKLVFKYKNLEVGNRFNQFLLELEGLSSDLSFYHLKRVVKKQFTIEECVTYMTCETREEVSLFYQRFGHLIGITHVLRGNDFHLENLIAVGSYPVLIDIETLIQNTGNTLDKGHALSCYSKEYAETIMGTSLLPNIHEDKQEQNEFSALKGGEQLLSEKVLQLVNKENGQLKMEYLDYIMPGADNLPLLKGEEISWLDYSQDILKGFTEIYELLISHKDVLIDLVEVLFSGVQVRNVLKGTQKYAEMLDYGCHPSYMTNYLNREKLFENIWAYSYENLAVVPHEIDDLLVNDIPIFSNLTNECGLLSSTGEKIKGFYSKPAIELVKERFEKLSNADYMIQRNRLTIALNLYKGECHKVELKKGDTLQKADQIAEIIYNAFIFGSDNRDVTLPRYSIDRKMNWKKDCMSASFYDGLAGIYLFYQNLQYIQPKARYKEVLRIMDNMYFKDVRETNNYEQYINNLSLLYVLFKKIEHNHNVLDSLMAKKILETIKTYYRKSQFNNEWLFGRSSLLKICLNLFQLPYFETTQEFIEEIIFDIELEKMDSASFAHGYAGVVYSLCCASEVFPDNESILPKLLDFVKAMEETDYIYDGTNTTWCNGLTGIGMALQKVIENGLVNDIIDFDRYQDLLDAVLYDFSEDDCLCHGVAGHVELFINAVNDLKVDNQLRVRIRKFISDQFSRESYHVQSLELEPEYNLMTGLAGIGYVLLRNSNDSVSNILLLE